MRLLLRAVLVMVVLGCAANKTSSPRVTPPELLTRSRPELQVPSGTPRQGVVLDIEIEVLVDAGGQPDLTTMRLTGLGATENRHLVTEWLQRVRFRPGQQGGVPVAATYRDRWRAEARTTVIRRS